MKEKVQEVIEGIRPTLQRDGGDIELVDVNEDGICVACGEGILLLQGIQCPGRKPLAVADFIRGRKIQPGEIFRS